MRTIAPMLSSVRVIGSGSKWPSTVRRRNVVIRRRPTDATTASTTTCLAGSSSNPCTSRSVSHARGPTSTSTIATAAARRSGERGRARSRTPARARGATRRRPGARSGSASGRTAPGVPSPARPRRSCRTAAPGDRTNAAARSRKEPVDCTGSSIGATRSKCRAAATQIQVFEIVEVHVHRAQRHAGTRRDLTGRRTEVALGEQIEQRVRDRVASLRRTSGPAVGCSRRCRSRGRHERAMYGWCTTCANASPCRPRCRRDTRRR